MNRKDGSTTRNDTDLEVAGGGGREFVDDPVAEATGSTAWEGGRVQESSGDRWRHAGAVVFDGEIQMGADDCE